MMAIGTVSEASAARALAAARLQLQQDQRKLAAGEQAGASTVIIAGHQARIALDQAQVAAASRSGSVDVYL